MKAEKEKKVKNTEIRDHGEGKTRVPSVHRAYSAGGRPTGNFPTRMGMSNILVASVSGTSGAVRDPKGHNYLDAYALAKWMITRKNARVSVRKGGLGRSMVFSTYRFRLSWSSLSTVSAVAMPHLNTIESCVRLPDLDRTHTTEINNGRNIEHKRGPGSRANRLHGGERLLVSCP